MSKRSASRTGTQAFSKRSAQRALLTAIVLTSFGNAGCTETNLQAIDDVDVRVVDNLLQIQGSVCTDPPEPTDFPVKVLFIIDGSESMQFIDNPTQRALAVEEVILRLLPNPSVSFAIIRFNEADSILTKVDAQGGVLNVTTQDPFNTDVTSAFTRDPAILQQAVQELRVADSVTDYQGALSTAYMVLYTDMLAAKAADLARSKYVVIFMSDGDPFPKCCSQMSQANGTCNPNTNIYFCEDPNAIRANPTQIPFLQAGEDYNQPYQIYASVRDIMDLAPTFGLGELRLHTAFLFDPSLVSQVNANGTYTIGGVYFVNLNEGRELLSTVAEIGQGVFKDFSRAEEIDFLQFDLTSIKREQALKNLIVTNTNLLPTAQGLTVDTDGDGLSDETEFEAGMNRLLRDSDDDGYGDAIEWVLRRSGFDPIMKNLGCADRGDPDSDELKTCEEILVRTSPDLLDSDADGIPDGVEVFTGSDPVKSDALADSDLDGIRNGDEIRAHTGIGFPEGSARPELAYRYQTSELGLNDKGERCYEFIAKNVQLGTPLAKGNRPDSYGENLVYVYMAQAPFDDPNDFGSFKEACVKSRYIAPDFKDPAQGIVKLAPEDFHEPGTLDLDSDCVGLKP